MSSKKPLESIVVTTRRIACDGGDPATGHPRVFLTMGADGTVDCPYCGRQYILSKSATDHASH